MNEENDSSNILGLLNQALARELQVSVQYMLQHAKGAGLKTIRKSPETSEKPFNFVASHSLYFIPGATLKKVAITEMRHAEAISERIVQLGGEPTTNPGIIKVEKTIHAMLEDDLEQEQEAIELYKKIIEISKKENDDITGKMFIQILKDEELHHVLFSDLLNRK